MLKITKQYTKEFNDKCNIARAHSFYRFIQNESNGKPIISYLEKIKNNKVISYKNFYPEKDIKIDSETIKKYVGDFYKKYLPKKAEEVNTILNKTHPYFMDKDGNSHINFIEVEKNDRNSSCVSHSDRNEFLEFNVYIHNTFDDLRITAHEISHALSAHHQNTIKMLRNGELNNVKCLDDVLFKGIEYDCIGEIESHIVEMLFNRYMFKQGLYTKK